MKPLAYDGHTQSVIPSREHNPERIYFRYGRDIKCFEILTFSDFPNTLIEYKPEPAFIIITPNEDAAKLLMNDLYYGEYTGA